MRLRRLADGECPQELVWALISLPCWRRAGNLMSNRLARWFRYLRHVRWMQRRWCSCCDLFRVDLGPAHESNAFLHCELAGADVAKEFRVGFNFDLIVGDNIPLDFAPHHYSLRIDVAGDHGVIAQVQSTIGLDFALYFSVEGQFSRKLECTLDFCARVEDVLGCFSTPCWRSVFSLWVNKFPPMLRLSHPFHLLYSPPFALRAKVTNRTNFFRGILRGGTTVDCFREKHFAGQKDRQTTRK